MSKPIAYTYDADTHCPTCAAERFGTCADGFIACPSEDCGGNARDAEGNEPGAIAPWDEWCDPSLAQNVLACGTCGDVIAECDHLPEPDECTCDNCLATVKGAPA